MGRVKKGTLYMMVSDDEYELPLIVGTMEEVVEFSGSTKQHISSEISRYEKGLRKGHFRRAETDETLRRYNEN